ncbi:hypothetical protein, conserved [Plasmodium gonderi]|uniref:Uncharacterized protein n=1 Tax=Plasmodium gonderi TaxID=77519 RepID=A0A1Y1JRW3_PLAGO|nr:hypothetical protein, conserved [Plasmodium gonderi]GAW83562.1 hypothetical protein, conserved [Plasmodium gonderi]
MKTHWGNEHINFCVVKFVLYFLIIKVYAIHHVGKNIRKHGLIMYQNEESDISINKIIPYSSDETTIFENYMLKNVSQKENVCIKPIRNYKNLSSPINQKFKLENQSHVIETGNKRNIYGYVKNLFQDLEYEISNKTLTFNVPITEEICEFNSFNNYILYVNYLKNINLEEIENVLKKNRFLFVRLPQLYDLNKTVAAFMGDKFSESKGILENDYIKIDISNIINYHVCPKWEYKYKGNYTDVYSNDNMGNKKVEKEIEFVLMTSHKLADIILFPSEVDNPQYFRQYKNIKNVVYLKKVLKQGHFEAGEWSPCYSVCSEDFSYRCRHNKCLVEDEDFCDRYFILNFQKCESVACQVLLKEEIKKVPGENIMKDANADNKKNDNVKEKGKENEKEIENEKGQENEKGKENEKEKVIAKDIIDANANANNPVAPVPYMNRHIESENYNLDDEPLSRRRSEKKISFFMWIINNKKMALGLLIFLISAVILGCIYCYVSSSLGFHNDEEYYVSKYRAHACQ